MLQTRVPSLHIPLDTPQHSWRRQRFKQQQTQPAHYTTDLCMESMSITCPTQIMHTYLDCLSEYWKGSQGQKDQILFLSQSNSHVSLWHLLIQASLVPDCCLFCRATQSLAQLPPRKRPKPRSRVCFPLLLLTYLHCCLPSLVSSCSAHLEPFLDASAWPGLQCFARSISACLLMSQEFQGSPIYLL